MKYDLIVRGGLAALESGPARADIFVSGGLIKKIVPTGTARAESARRLVDASGLIVLPGIIDAHVHYSLHLGGGKMTADDFYSGSAAAACGGVTTVIDYTGQASGVPLEYGLRARQEEAEGLMHVDYGFHAVVPSWKSLDRPSEQIRKLMALGVSSFKFFTAYESRGLMASDSELFEALETSRRTGALVCVHAESGGLIELLTSRAELGRSRGADALRLSRPAYTESEAVGRVLTLARIAGGSVYFVHLSAAASAELIAEAAASGVNALGETCPQYLLLDESLLRRKNGHLYATCPPVRSAGDSKALWEGLRKGALQVVATDNCTFTRAQKDLWKGDIRALYMGMPGTQTLLPLMYTAGVREKRLTLTQLAAALSLNPAKIMGLYPSKGAIRTGSDADLALIDPRSSKKVDHARLKHRTDYSPYQGMELYGWPVMTILRGKVAAENGELTAPERPSGRFLRRGRSITAGKTARPARNNAAPLRRQP